MDVINVGTKKQIGPAQLVIYVILKETQWKGVVLEWTKLIGGTFQRVTLANVATNKLAGDAIIVTLITQKGTPVNVETSKQIGVAQIVIEILLRVMLAINVRTRRPTGVVIIVIGFHQKVTLARNVITSKLIGHVKTAIGNHQKVMLVRNVITNKQIGHAKNVIGNHLKATLAKNVVVKHDFCFLTYNLILYLAK